MVSPVASAITPTLRAGSSTRVGALPSLSERLRASLPQVEWRTRFAPAPTGYLHLGHLVNAIHVWGIARAYGGRVALRIEDHDRTRCKPVYETALHDDLEWLGFEADIAPSASFGARAHTDVLVRPHEYRQSDQPSRYTSALATLESEALAFVCACTRREIAVLTSRVVGEELRYPGTCRNANVSPHETFARRVRMDDFDVHFDDLRVGRITQNPSTQCGDVLVRDRHANWTYQFSVAVDDRTHNIDVIIRGEDLLSSTGRQFQLARLLGRTTMPLTLHHALLRHPDGTKLSKANNDTALGERRRNGATPQTLLGEAAHLVGLQPTLRSLDVADLADLFLD